MRSAKWLAATALFVAACLALPCTGFGADKDSSDSAKKSGTSASERSDSQNQDSARNRQTNNDDEDAQHHAALGVSLTESDGQVKVIAVLPGSPADRAGLKAGDQIRYVGDQRIRTAQGLAEEIGEYRPGSQVELSIRRDGEKKTMHARLASSQTTFRSRERGNTNANWQNDNRWNEPQANQNQRAAYSYLESGDQQNASSLSQQVRTLQQRVSRLEQELNMLRTEQNGNRRQRVQEELYRDSHRSSDANGQATRTSGRQQQYDHSDRDDD